MAVAGAIGAALVLAAMSFCAAGAVIGAGAIGAAAAISHVLVLCLSSAYPYATHYYVRTC